MTDQSRHFPDLPQSVVEALWRGNRREAIERLQQEHNLDQAEAREHVAAYILSHSALKRRMVNAESETRWSFMWWLILLQAIAVAVGYYLLFE